MQSIPVKFSSAHIPAHRIDERRYSQRTPLMLSAWIWRTESPDQGTAIRLLDHSEYGVGFVSPVPMDTGEIFQLSLELNGTRRSGLQVTHCEFFNDQTFRIGARTVSAPTLTIDPNPS